MTWDTKNLEDIKIPIICGNFTTWPVCWKYLQKVQNTKAKKKKKITDTGTVCAQTYYGNISYGNTMLPSQVSPGSTDRQYR